MQTPNYIEAQDVLSATNGGLDIIFWLYPQAQGSETNRNRKFKLRDDEKTASANLKKADDGNWLVTDFGGDQQPRNAIMCYAFENNVDFVTALRQLAAQFNIAGTEQQQLQIRAEYSERPAGTDEKELSWDWDVRETWTDIEIETIISKNVLRKVSWKSQDEAKAKQAAEDLKQAFESYHWHPLISYSLVKNRKVMTFASTDQYPIYLIDEGSHQKLYQPLHPDKAKRFLYIGTKPKDFMHGLSQLKKAYADNEERLTKEANERKEAKDRQNEDDNSNVAGDSTDNSISMKARFPQVILCSGGSDAINVSLLGYYVLWMNSETAKLPEYQYKEISKCVEKIYQLQDIDNTGKRSAHELAMEYLDICTIELPEDLKRHRDRRGNPCKDVRDYFNHYKTKEFKELLKVALPYRFWDKKSSYEGRGDEKKFVGYRYEFRNTQANNFLSKNGFGRLKVGDEDKEWIYVKRTGNIVKEVDAGMIMEFIDEFLESRNMDIDLRDAIINTGKLNASTLARIKRVDIDFEDYTPTSQFFFFENKTVEITKDSITYHRPGVIDRYIWDRDYLAHNIKPVEQAPFTITRDELGAYDIEINHQDCLFFKYLIQVSRVHWRAEMEGERWAALTPVEQDAYKIKHHCDIAGPNLKPEEIEEQKTHLINKIFGIGFMLHHYHDRTKGWFTYAVDGKLSEDGRSHGGSGKSLLMDMGLRKMMPSTFFINGRSRDLLEDRFKYDTLRPHHRYYLVDDCFEHIKLDSFYVDVSGDLVCPRKGTSSLTIPFEKSGKFGFTANYMPKDVGPSTERRIIYMVFSDYYHNKGQNDDYLEFRDPKVDLGQSMFVGFDDKQYNQFYHTMMYCLQFYLGTTEKIGAAMNNVNKRTLLAEMGDNFHSWALAYFSEESGNIDRFVVREYVFEDFKNATKDRNMSANNWWSRLAAFCKYYGFVFNPKPYLNKQKKIIKKAEVKFLDKDTKQWKPVLGAEKSTKEMIFIQTLDTLPEDPRIGHVAGEVSADAPEKPKLDF